jgi:hypothetical protein
MKKAFAVAVFLFCCLIAPNSYSYLRSRGDSGDGILTKRLELHLRKESLILVLGTLSVDHRVPIGIEYSSADKNEAKISIDVEHATLRQVLDSIVQQEPVYRWEIVDGVINFVPTRERDPFFEALLSTPVAHFDPGKWTVIFAVRDAIGDIPEVKRLLNSQHKTVAKYSDYAMYPSIYTKKDVDLKVSNTTVRGVLNRIIRDSDHKGWSIGWQAGDKNVVSLRF